MTFPARASDPFDILGLKIAIVKSPMAVFVFGSNIMGQCGLPDDHSASAVPTALGIDGDRVECGYLHALVLSNGQVVSWGVNDEGALGRSGDEFPARVEIGERVVEISAGASASAAVTESGDLFVWGTFRDRHGVFGIAPGCAIAQRPIKILSGVAKVACGRNFVAAVTKNNALVTFGVGDSGELGYRASTRSQRCLVPRQISNRYKKAQRFVDVFAGTRSGLAIAVDERVYAWDAALHVAFSAPAVAAAVGSAHEFVLDKNGCVFARGNNADAQLGLGTKGAAVDDWQKVAIAGVEKIRTKMDFTIAKVGNDLFSWGPSTFGETGFDRDSVAPQKIPFDFGKVVDFAVGSDFAVVIGK